MNSLPACKSVYAKQKDSPPSLAACITMRRLLVPTDTDVVALIEHEPALLIADLDKVVADIRRLMPTADPGMVIATNPGIVLDMRTHRMESSEERVIP